MTLLYNINFSQILIQILMKKLDFRIFVFLSSWHINKTIYIPSSLHPLLSSRNVNSPFLWTGLVWNFLVWYHGPSYVWISILFKFLNFDFRFLKFDFFFINSFKFDSTVFSIPDLNPMKTWVKGTCVVCIFPMLLNWSSSPRIFKSYPYCPCKNNMFHINFYMKAFYPSLNRYKIK